MTLQMNKALKALIQNSSIMRFKNGKGSDTTYSEFSVLNLVSGDDVAQGRGMCLMA